MDRPRTGVAFARMPEPKIDNERHEPRRVATQTLRWYAQVRFFQRGKNNDRLVHTQKQSFIRVKVDM